MHNGLLLKALFFLMLVFVMPVVAFSEENLEYVRMWPVLKQPWYFSDPHSIAVDKTREVVYISDTSNNRILKFSFDGQFITKWGSSGGGVGKFYEPRGIAVDSGGYIYVADTGNSRIQKFTSDGQYVKTWGRWGAEAGYLDSPSDVVLDASGNFYVADAGNNRIQKFNSNGTFITAWGTKGTGEAQFSEPYYITIDEDSYIYVSDTGNDRIQKFTSEGVFVTQWGAEGTRDGQFNEPHGITSDKNGYIYVADVGNACIQKFTSEGQFILKWRGEEIDETGYGFNGWGFHGITADDAGNIYIPDSSIQSVLKFTSDGAFISKWESSGNGNGEFNGPYNIAVDGSGSVYVSDSGNNRIQKFSSAGTFITKWGRDGYGNGQFYSPQGIAADNSGNIYVSDGYRIQKFSSEGTFMTTWGSEGSGDGQFQWPQGISIDSAGNIYVADTHNHRIQKFDSEGKFLKKWGTEGSGNGQFNYPRGIKADSAGNIYVADTDNNRIQKFSSEGKFISKWGSEGTGALQFYGPQGIEIDDSGNIYIADTYNSRIQKLTSDGLYISEFGTKGSDAGQFSYPIGLAINNDSLFIADTSNNRIQLFQSPSTVALKEKAIIVAGGGPFTGNTLWDATQMNANYAYRALNIQGYKDEDIYYLSSSTGLDLNDDGKSDVDADAANSNLQNAITTWAADADSVLLYMIDHGGNGTFRMSGSETLSASELDGWLDTLQKTTTGTVAVVYDACESGSFLSALIPPSDSQRVVITSTASGEYAYFLNSGMLSFSYLFWSQIFGGANLYDAFNNAKDSIGFLKDDQKDQTPQLDDNGNGIGNETSDGTTAKNFTVGKGIVTAADLPVLTNITGSQALSGESSATVEVNISSLESITRVWAVIQEPTFTNTSDAPVTEMETFELTSGASNRYAGTYSGFASQGEYTITVYALNEKGTLSLPAVTNVQQTTDSGAPAADIKANEKDNSLNIKTSDEVSISIKLDSGNSIGANADWWMFVYSQFGTFYYDLQKGWSQGYKVTYTGGLLSLPSYEILKISGLPSGTYNFYFGVDMNPNGTLDGQKYMDKIDVNVTE